jgi:PST family polysaccharide transporter
MDTGVAVTTRPGQPTGPPTGPEETPAAETKRLDRSLVRGMVWTGSIKWISQVVSWITTILVARLLHPEDYGLVAMAASFTSLLAVVNEFGVGITVVSMRRLGEDRLAQLHTFAVAMGVAGLLLTCAAAVPLGYFFQAAALPPLVSVMGLGFVISAWRSVPQALLQKDLRWRMLAGVEGVVALVQAAGVLTLAYFGFGYWALAVGGMLGQIVWSGLILAIQPQGFARPDPRALREAMTFSWYVVVTRISWYMQSASDSLIIGRVLGPNALGVYSMAFSLAMLPVEKVAALVSSVTTALFAAVQDNAPAARRYLLLLTEGFALIAFPATLGIALVANEAVTVVLGPKWAAVVAPLQVFAFYAAFKSVQTLPAQVLFVTGGARLAMWNSFATALVLPTAFYLGTHWGIAGVAAVWLIVHPIASIPINWFVFRRTELRISQYLRALWPAFTGSLAMLAGVLGCRAALPADWSTAARLAAMIGGGAVVYVAFVLLFHRARLATFVQLVRKGEAAPR